MRILVLALLLAGCDMEPRSKPMTPAEQRAAIDECEHYGLRAVPLTTMASYNVVKIVCQPRPASEVVHSVR